MIGYGHAYESMPFALLLFVQPLGDELLEERLVALVLLRRHRLKALNRVLVETDGTRAVYAIDLDGPEFIYA